MTELHEMIRANPWQTRIVRDTDPKLREHSSEITEFEFGEELRVLTNNMLSTMKLYGGIGLAAPQVGINKRVIVVDFDPYVLVNPTIDIRSENKQKKGEGCLSSPGLWLDVERYHSIRVNFTTVDGPNVDGKLWQHFDGRDARVIQHEVDHLDGKLFTDRVSPMALLLARKKRK